jgi:hypothetical protein
LLCCGVRARRNPTRDCDSHAGRGCSSHAGRELPTALPPGRAARACKGPRPVRGPSRARHGRDDRRGAALESQGEGKAATGDSGGRPGSGQGAPLLVSIVGGKLLGIQAAGRPFRSWCAPRGRVALEYTTGLRDEADAEHALRLGAQELGPAGADPARRRPQARDAQHARDRGGRDADSKLQQLPLDAHIAPARVLPGQPEDQAARLGRKRRTTRPATAPSAIALQQRPVPAAKRLRADRRARPPLGRKQPARRSKQRPVSCPVLRPAPSAPQDRQLVAQNHDL